MADSKCGYRNPGLQNISVNEAIANLYFMSDKEWETDRTKGKFEYVIIGSSFCAMGFIHRALEKNPDSKILIIERGEYVHSQAIQDLSPLNLGSIAKSTESFHWKIHQEGEHVKYVRGVNNLFGGRSSFWKAWCPKPTTEEMSGWPDEVIQKVDEYFPAAAELLNVRPVNEIKESFGNLQETIFKALESTPSVIEAEAKIHHAPLAVIENKCRYGDHQKYSAIRPLLNMMKEKQNVKAIVHCLVIRIRHDVNGRATVLETNRGEFTLGDAKLILAMSTLPSTTLMLNSFPQLTSIGTRFTAHFVSTIHARVPSTRTYGLFKEQAQGRVEMSAIYITGESKESKHQFHIQLTAVAVTDEETMEDYDSMRHLLKTPSNEQLKTSKGHVVFVCACLGQLDHDNPENKFCLNKDAEDEDKTYNTTLHFVVNDKDMELWDTMDESTYRILEHLSMTPSGKTIEYWNSKEEKWYTERPPVKQIRSDGLVHPASTMWIGSDDESPVNLHYQFRGVDNVYLTGGALWPTGGSWNPTCTMTAMAMDLADKCYYL